MEAHHSLVEHERCMQVEVVLHMLEYEVVERAHHTLVEVQCRIVVVRRKLDSVEVQFRIADNSGAEGHRKTDLGVPRTRFREEERCNLGCQRTDLVLDRIAALVVGEHHIHLKGHILVVHRIVVEVEGHRMVAAGCIRLDCTSCLVSAARSIG